MILIQFKAANGIWHKLSQAGERATDWTEYHYPTLTPSFYFERVFHFWRINKTLEFYQDLLCQRPLSTQLLCILYDVLISYSHVVGWPAQCRCLDSLNFWVAYLFVCLCVCLFVTSQNILFPRSWRPLVKEHIHNIGLWWHNFPKLDGVGPVDNRPSTD